MNSSLPHLETTSDSFFAGKLTVLQPQNGFRAGSDSLLLAASVDISNLDSLNILELGSGAGVVSLALAYRTCAKIVGIEINEDMVALANYNAQLNCSRNHVNFLQGNVLEIKTIMHRGQDVVMFNPPFYNIKSGRSSPNSFKAQSTHSDDANLCIWVRTAITCLKQGGQLITIVPPDRLKILLNATQDKVGAVEIMPIYVKPNTPALRVIVKGKKARKTPLKFLPAFYMQNHDGTLTQQMRAITEDGHKLNFDI